MKVVVLALAIIGILARGFFVYQAHQAQTARDSIKTAQTISQIRGQMRGEGADAAADAEAFGKTPGAASAKLSATALAANSPAAAAPKPAVPAVPAASAPPAVDATQRGEVQSALDAMKLTTIMPGAPGLLIIDKKEYSEGEDIALPGGRRARIVSVQDDGVQLKCNGATYRLPAPAAPDLAASRKKR